MPATKRKKRTTPRRSTSKRARNGVFDFFRQAGTRVGAAVGRRGNGVRKITPAIFKRWIRPLLREPFKSMSWSQYHREFPDVSYVAFEDGKFLGPTDREGHRINPLPQRRTVGKVKNPVTLRPGKAVSLRGRKSIKLVKRGGRAYLEVR